MRFTSSGFTSMEMLDQVSAMHVYLRNGNNRDTSRVFPGQSCSLIQILLITQIYIDIRAGEGNIRQESSAQYIHYLRSLNMDMKVYSLSDLRFLCCKQ